MDVVNIPVTNNILNLAQLHEKMNETVFNYIDSSQHWDKAYKELENLVHQVVEYFNNWVDIEGRLPKIGTYWTLFMDIVSQLLYFYGLAWQQLMADQDEVEKDKIVNIYTVAANCMPNVKSEEGQAFLEEITKSYEQLNSGNGTLSMSSKTVSNCITTFSEFSENYQK